MPLNRGRQAPSLPDPALGRPRSGRSCPQSLTQISDVHPLVSAPQVGLASESTYPCLDEGADFSKWYTSPGPQFPMPRRNTRSFTERKNETQHWR